MTTMMIGIEYPGQLLVEGNGRIIFHLGGHGYCLFHMQSYVKKMA